MSQTFDTNELHTYQGNGILIFDSENGYSEENIIRVGFEQDNDSDISYVKSLIRMLIAL